MRPDLVTDLKWGIQLGAFAAAFVTALAAVAVAVQGTAGLTRIGLSFGGLIALYAFGGVVGGAVLGALRPWIRWMAPAVGIVAIAFVPFSLAMGVLLNGWITSWDRGEWFVAVIFIPIAFSLIAVVTVRDDIPKRMV
jgi:hypothetical protein